MCLVLLWVNGLMQSYSYLLLCHLVWVYGLNLPVYRLRSCAACQMQFTVMLNILFNVTGPELHAILCYTFVRALIQDIDLHPYIMIFVVLFDQTACKG